MVILFKTWSDSRLTWDPAKYNVSNIMLKIHEIWTPTGVIASLVK